MKTVAQAIEAYRLGPLSGDVEGNRKARALSLAHLVVAKKPMDALTLSDLRAAVAEEKEASGPHAAEPLRNALSDWLDWCVSRGWIGANDLGKKPAAPANPRKGFTRGPVGPVFIVAVVLLFVLPNVHALMLESPDYARWYLINGQPIDVLYVAALVLGALFCVVYLGVKLAIRSARAEQ